MYYSGEADARGSLCLNLGVSQHTRDVRPRYHGPVYLDQILNSAAKCMQLWIWLRHSMHACATVLVAELVCMHERTINRLNQ
jgi:hypothetical protein